MISLTSLISGVSWRGFGTAFALINAVGMAVVVEFIWTVQGFRDRKFLGLARALWILVAATDLCSIAFFDAGWVPMRAYHVGTSLLFLFNVLMVGADIWAIAVRGRSRAIAVADLLISVGFFLGFAGHPLEIPWLRVNFFGAAFYLSSVVVAALLIRQTWQAWKKNDGLRIEIAAARELQQQLVPLALPKIAGLRLDAAYLPAQEVGGDFYQVLEQSDSSTLVLVGRCERQGTEGGHDRRLDDWRSAGADRRGDGAGPAADQAESGDGAFKQGGIRYPACARGLRPTAR